MDRATLLHVIKTCGDQSLPEADRWKSINHMVVDSVGNINNIKKRVLADEIRFVDKSITVEGQTSQLTGFYLLENQSVDVDFAGNTRHLTFIPAVVIMSITFNNSTAAGTARYSTIEDFLTAVP